MIKKLKVTVDGQSYDVTVELQDDRAGLASAVPLPAAVPASAPAPAPVPATPSGGPGNVPSPLAGRVIAVNIAVGQTVKEGDHLVTLEAMKMNTFVMAPKGGNVAAVQASVGDAVEEGQTLVRIE